MNFRKKASNSIKKRFDSETLYNKKYLKTKIKSHEEKVTTIFYNDKIQIEVSQFICLLVILIDSVQRTGKNHYRQVFLAKCKYVDKKIGSQYVTDDIEISPDDFDQGISDKQNSNKKRLMKKLKYRMGLVFIFLVS